MPITPLADWLTEARRRFGDDAKNWKFQCPICKNIQTPADFHRIGVDARLAYQECIGRHIENPARHLASTPGANGKKYPCDYAAYGLFSSGIQVQPESGKPVHVFPFADEAPLEASGPDGTRAANNK